MLAPRGVTIQHPIRPINPVRRSAAVTDGEDEARLQPAVQRRSGEESVSLSLSLLVPSLSTSESASVVFLKSKVNLNQLQLSLLKSKRATVKKGAQVAKIPNPRAAIAEENIKERKLRRKLRTEESVNVKQQPTNVIIISTETSNGRTVKERLRKKKTGGRPTFTSLLTARSKEATAIGSVARKREDLIIINIDEASGDDELAVAEYAEDIYKFYKLTEKGLFKTLK
ncbi:hypothetical protein Dimus_018782 [Dionaea muscipula]